MISNTVRTVATRAVSRRAMSDAAGPKMHKAKDVWKQLETTRPPVGHPHVSLETAERGFFKKWNGDSVSVCRSEGGIALKLMMMMMNDSG